MQDCLRPTWVCKPRLNCSKLLLFPVSEPSIHKPHSPFKFTIKSTVKQSLHNIPCFARAVWAKAAIHIFVSADAWRPCDYTTDWVAPKDTKVYFDRNIWEKNMRELKFDSNVESHRFLNTAGTCADILWYFHGNVSFFSHSKLNFVLLRQCQLSSDLTCIVCCPSHRLK